MDILVFCVPGKVANLHLYSPDWFNFSHDASLLASMPLLMKVPSPKNLYLKDFVVALTSKISTISSLKM